MGPSPDGTVRCRAPKGVLTAMELFTDLRASGAVLIPMFDHVRIAAPPGAPCLALLRDLLDLLELYGERAALAQYCGGLPRADAEALAWHALVEQGSEYEWNRKLG
jgi:hypothetical protein